MKSANDGHNDKRAKACPTTSANDMVVSDDDSATAQNKNLNNASYLESDDETVIESDQPLFLDTPAPVGKENGNPILGSDVGVGGEDAAMMAAFLQDTFEQTATQSHQQPEASTFGDVMDENEMDALLNSNDSLMLLPDLCLEC